MEGSWKKGRYWRFLERATQEAGRKRFLERQDATRRTWFLATQDGGGMRHGRPERRHHRLGKR
jgi:hypothetical protein